MKIPVNKILLILCSLICLSTTVAIAYDNEDAITYELALSFEIDKQLLYGTAHIVLPAEAELSLILGNVNISRIVLNKPSAPPSIIEHQDVSHLKLPSADVQQEIFISYTKKVSNQKYNIITNNGITLLQNWYPYPTHQVVFSVITELPPDFTAITESDNLAAKKNGHQHFTFSKPTQSIHFVAAPFIIGSLKVRPGLNVYTYFQSENQDLSTDYLQASAGYVKRYEQIIGEYPYSHFAIVENIFPTGYGMPTFTLLGKSVIRLPFIKDTSLGHEILHSWFGNSIEVADNSANWAEGLASYMADWLYREDKQQGAVNRKEQILKYLHYVTEKTAIPLKSFTSASHNQPMARSVRSVGYIKGAMIFHELRETYGKKAFYKALQSLYSRFRDKKAGWDDIQDVFEGATGDSLDAFFQQRLDLATIPDFTIANLTANVVDEQNSLSLLVRQNTDVPFQFTLPIEVETSTGTEFFQKQIQSATEEILLQLNSPPTLLTIDPSYDLLRKLAAEERVVTWSFFMGPNPVWVLPENNNESTFKTFLDYFNNEQWQLKTPGSFNKSELANHNLILLGADNPIATSYFGKINRPPSGMVIESRKHPLNKDKFILLLSASAKDEVNKVFRKLSHYGKYSYLHFIDGRIVDKEFKPGQMGMQFQVAEQPRILPTKKVQDFEDTISEVAKAKVIYLGETHTSMTDHHFQYLVIENLYKRNKEIAIGLEMFPASSQEVLDAYITADSKMSEREFLKQSRYFEVWRFDYRNYRKIINFAKAKGIPLRGLNIEREIVGSIFQNGSPDKLTTEQLQLLPEEMDLSLPGYYDRLSSMHNLHVHGGHGKGNVSGFIKAQATWDEVMAENIAEYLAANPTKQMIVLAGSQHTRKDSGIPPRVQRRLDVPQVSLHTANNAEKPAQDVADYFVYLNDVQLPAAGKIGISLEEKAENGDNFVTITGITAGSSAGKAGLRPGDLLQAIDGYIINDMDDIRIAMVGALPGETLQVEVSRSTFGMEPEKLQFGVELHQPNEQPR